MSDSQNTLVEAHEDRIQRLEENHTEIHSGLTENTVRLEHLAQAFEEGHKALEWSIDTVATRIEAAMNPLSEKVGVIIKQIDKHEEKLTALERREAAREDAREDARLKRGQVFKKTLLWALALVVGSILTKSSEWMFHFFG